MDFNISDILKRRQSLTTPETIILNILQMYEPNIHLSQVDVHRGVLRLKHISPHQKTHILLNKIDILNHIKSEGIHIHDIM